MNFYCINSYNIIKDAVNNVWGSFFKEVTDREKQRIDIVFGEAYRDVRKNGYKESGTRDFVAEISGVCRNREVYATCIKLDRRFLYNGTEAYFEGLFKFFSKEFDVVEVRAFSMEEFKVAAWDLYLTAYKNQSRHYKKPISVIKNNTNNLNLDSWETVLRDFNYNLSIK